MNKLFIFLFAVLFLTATASARYIIYEDFDSGLAPDRFNFFRSSECDGGSAWTTSGGSALGSCTSSTGNWKLGMQVYQNYSWNNTGLGFVVNYSSGSDAESRFRVGFANLTNQSGAWTQMSWQGDYYEVVTGSDANVFIEWVTNATGITIKNNGAYVKTIAFGQTFRLPTIFVTSGGGFTANLRIHNVTMYQSELTINQTHPLNLSTFTNSSINFTSNISSSFAPFNYFNVTNVTFNIHFVNGTRFNSTILSTNFVNSTIVSLVINNLTLGTYLWNINACETNQSFTYCNTTSNLTFYAGIRENSYVYNSSTSVASQESFIANITTSSSLSSAILIWNGTSYSASVSSIGGNDYQLSRTITIPNVLGTINWFYSLYFADGTNINLTTKTQTTAQASIDDCSTFTRQILNFSLLDEDARTYINGTIELIINLTNPQGTASAGVYNATYVIVAPTPARVCINNTNSSYSLNYQAKYYSNTSLYVVENKFARKITLTNSTALQQVNLYDLLFTRSTPFTITLQAPDLSLISDAIIDVQRQYVGIDQYLSVESPVTAVNGQTTAHLVETEVYYNFVVSKNGTIIGTFNRNLAQCQNVATGDCRINLNLVNTIPSLPSFNNYGNISINFQWSASTRTLLFNFLSTDNLNHVVAWNVSRLDNWGNTTICTNSVSGTIGTFTCTIPTLYGNTSIIADIFSDGVYLGRNTFSLGQTSESIFGGARVVLGLLMYSTITLLFFAHPVTIILGAMFGMGFAIAFHFVDGGTFLGNTSIFLWFIIAGGIILFYMRNK